MIVSIKDIRLQPREEITGFEIEVSGIGFESISSLPKGWRISIDNKSLTQTRLSADLAFGPETMNVTQMQEVVMKFADAGLDPPLIRLSGHLVVTDYAQERHVALTQKQFVPR